MKRIQDIPITDVPQWLIDNADYDDNSLDDLCTEIKEFLEKE